jgi:hypothetical protein
MIQSSWHQKAKKRAIFAKKTDFLLFTNIKIVKI